MAQPAGSSVSSVNDARTQRRVVTDAARRRGGSVMESIRVRGNRANGTERAGANRLRPVVAADARGNSLPPVEAVQVDQDFPTPRQHRPRQQRQEIVSGGQEPEQSVDG